MAKKENGIIEKLRKKVKKNGKKIFILGTSPAVANMELSPLQGQFVLGLNGAFRAWPAADALIFADKIVIKDMKWDIKKWQRSQTPRPVLFWHNVESKKGFKNIVLWIHTKARVMVDNAPDADIPIFTVCHSIATCALGCAHWLGANQIYFLGVELANAGHFYQDTNKRELDQMGKPYKNSDKILKYIGRQCRWLAERGVTVANCTPAGRLDEIMPHVKLAEAVK